MLRDDSAAAAADVSATSGGGAAASLPRGSQHASVLAANLARGGSARGSRFGRASGTAAGLPVPRGSQRASVLAMHLPRGSARGSQFHSLRAAEQINILTGDVAGDDPSLAEDNVAAEN